MVRKQAKPEVNFRLRMNTVTTAATGLSPPQTAKPWMVRKADLGLNRAFSVFVNRLATNAA
jgi:hypothetical protein